MCDLSPKAEGVPTFARESERGAFVREVEMRKKTDLRSECADNFLTIFAGTVLDEKPNFTGKFFEWQRPFDFSTDRLCICQAEISFGIHGTYSLLSLITA